MKKVYVKAALVGAMVAGIAINSCKKENAATSVTVASVSLNKTTLTLTAGDTATLTATVLPANATDKAVTWTSSDSTKATVANGVVTAVAAGSATITATAGDNKTATCAVTVSAAIVAVTGISLNETTLALTVGDNETLTATVLPANAADPSVTWTSSDDSKATVSSSGEVTAVAAGTATITATAGAQTATCAVTVSAAIVAVTGISLNETTLALGIGDNETLTATVLPANATDPTVTWTSSDDTKATVSSSGEVTAVAEGTATITATAGAQTATCAVTIAPVDVTGISLDATTLALAIGENATLTATVLPNNATDPSVTWTSSDDSKATVSSSGEVTAVAEGTATITATAGAQTATCAVTIEGVLINGVKWATRNVDAVGTFAASPEDAGMFYQWNRQTAWAAGAVSGWNSSGDSGSSWETDKSPCPDGWCLPTATEITALINATNVSHEWITINSVNGRKFTDNTINASLFLPAVGLLSSINGSLGSTTGGYYYINAKFSGNPRFLNITSTGAYANASAGGTITSNSGCSVRCVKNP
ncbi:hypothetical protein FACS189452_00640 [Bacteroidia bacterium]|nr:hypothetical protein FACS189452_00640 [Bacteroidia bacterium]